ncbi:hypothetical protein Tco_0179624 [Tanacetum coccineum]
MWHRSLYYKAGMRNHLGRIQTSVLKCEQPSLNGMWLLNATNCKRIGHIWPQELKSSMLQNATNNQRAQAAIKDSQLGFDCGAQCHLQSNCPNLRKESGNAGYKCLLGCNKAYSGGTVMTNLTSNGCHGTFLLNNCYASILFDTVPIEVSYLLHLVL